MVTAAGEEYKQRSRQLGGAQPSQPAMVAGFPNAKDVSESMGALQARSREL